MARRANNTAINAKMYKHFAIFTVIATAMLALFAEGENRQAMAEELSELEKKREAHEQSKQAAYGKPILKRKEPKKTARFAHDHVPFGTPTTRTGTSVRYSSALPLRPEGNLVNDEAFAEFGIPLETLKGMPEKQRAALLKRLRDNRYGTSPEEREKQLAALIKASANRSGSNLER